MNLSSYAILFNSSPAYFPNDPFFPVRDYSFVRPSAFGTFEFRSACSQPAVPQVIEVAAFRILQIVYATMFRENPIQPQRNWQREALLRQAIHQTPLNELTTEESTSIARARLANENVPISWRSIVESLLTRLASVKTS